MNAATGVHYIKASPPYYLNQGTGVHYATVDDYLRDCVVPTKDVEGLCHSANAKLFRARGGEHYEHLRTPNEQQHYVYVPCTVTAVLKILETYYYFDASAPILDDEPKQLVSKSPRWKGITMTVVNRSNILGRPLAALLALEGASVYSVDHASTIHFKPGGQMLQRLSDVELNDCLRQSSVVVTAVPGNDFMLDCTAIQDGTMVIDVSECSNVNHDEILGVSHNHATTSNQVARGIQLIPNVGKVTVAALQHNLIRLHHQQKDHI